MSYPNLRLIRLWLSCNGYQHYVASNPVTFLSVDFPPVVSCPIACDYCYARRGRQAMPRALELQHERYRRYRSNPERYAESLCSILENFNRAFGLPIGSPRYPLRLFGAGDLGDDATFRRFHAALERGGVASFGYSRHLGVPDNLWFSADRDTPPAVLKRARREGRRIAFVRQIGDEVPDGTELVFPEHRQAQRLPVHELDCPKIRTRHEPGVCYDCQRCFTKAA